MPSREMELWTSVEKVQTTDAKSGAEIPSLLADAYGRMSGEEQLAAHVILRKWLASVDARQRFDAKYVISQRRLVELTGALIEAIEVAKRKSGVAAREEAHEFERVLLRLATIDLDPR